LHYCLYYACRPKKRQKPRANKEEVKSARWFNRGQLDFLNPPMDEAGIKICEEAMKLAKEYYRRK
jgi:uracil-DNA glycosylase